MRKLKLTVLILTAMFILNSCGKNENKEEVINPLCREGLHPYYVHTLWLSFQDKSGNDLLKGSEFELLYNYNGIFDTVKPEFYTLEIIYEKGIINPWLEPGHYKNGTDDIIYPKLYLASESVASYGLLNNDYDYLRFHTESTKLVGNFPKKIIFRFTCPYLFGDNKVHDIVTRWKFIDTYCAPLCYRIEYGGKEFSVKLSNDNFATVILNR